MGLLVGLVDLVDPVARVDQAVLAAGVLQVSLLAVGLLVSVLVDQVPWLRAVPVEDLLVALDEVLPAVAVLGVADLAVQLVLLPAVQPLGLAEAELLEALAVVVVLHEEHLVAGQVWVLEQAAQVVDLAAEAGQVWELVAVGVPLVVVVEAVLA